MAATRRGFIRLTTVVGCCTTFFGGNLNFPKNYEIEKKFVQMSETAQKCEINAIFKQNYNALKLLISFKMAYSYFFKG